MKESCLEFNKNSGKIRQQCICYSLHIVATLADKISTTLIKIQLNRHTITK